MHLDLFQAVNSERGVRLFLDLDRRYDQIYGKYGHAAHLIRATIYFRFFDLGPMVI